MILEFQSLTPFHTFGVKATARYFTRVNSLVGLKRAFDTDCPAKLLLGGGSNVLFLEDYDGLVIVNELKGIEILDESRDHIWVRAASGEVWHNFVCWAVDRGFGGIENLSLIPGTVGAAPIQNIGAYGAEVKDVIEEIEVMELGTGLISTFSNEEAMFGYRTSIFKTTAKGKYVITSVVFKLSKAPVLNMKYGDIRATLEDMGVNIPTVKDLSKAVIAIRSSKLPDPAELGNAGSFFKNPEIAEDKYRSLVEIYPLMPGYPAGEGFIKVAAGWLIEQAGWKGKREGDAGCHARQALVLVNYGNASGRDIWNLAMKIKASVVEKFGINLEPEVNLIENHQGSSQ